MPRNVKTETRKHTCCPSFIRITIKQTSMGWYVLLANNIITSGFQFFVSHLIRSHLFYRSSDILLKEYPCEIQVQFTHNHPLVAPDVLRHRRPSEETKKKFLGLFSNGYSALSAIEAHRFDLFEEYGDDFDLYTGDGAICPSNFWVYKLYKKVSTVKFGPQCGLGMIDALRSYCTKFNEESGSECMKVELLNG